MKTGWALYQLQHVLGHVYKTKNITVDGRKTTKRVLVEVNKIVTTADVRNALKLSQATVSRWLKHPAFITNEIAFRDGGGCWQWNRERTIIWVIAALKLEPAVAENPPSTNWQEAREQLGIQGDSPFVHG